MLILRICLCLPILAPLLCYGQSYVVSGNITDAKTKYSMQGVAVQVNDLRVGTVSNTEGKFSIKVPEGSHQLSFSYVGYETITKMVSTSVEFNVDMKGSNMLEAVIIKSVRAGEYAPVPRTRTSKKEIERNYVGQDAPFILEKITPSIVSYSESGTRVNNYSHMRLRGIDMQRINYTLNGIPLNDMIDHGVFFSNFPGFGNSLESVEVQRGVGTSTNGTASYAGSVNFESINLEKTKTGAEIQLGAGSYNSYRGSVEYTTGVLENNTAFYGRFSRIYSDGYRHNTFTNSHSFFFSGGYFGEKNLIKVNAFTARSQNGLAYLASPQSDIEQDRRHNPLNENDTDDFGQQFIQLQHVYAFSDEMNLNSSIYYGGAGGDFFFSSYSSNTINQINYPLRNDHFGAMSTFTISKNSWEINVGVHAYQFYRKNHESLIPEDVNPYYSDESRKGELSIFTKVKYALLPGLNIHADMQVRSANLSISPDTNFHPDNSNALTIAPLSPQNIKRSWTFVNPKIGLTYQINSSSEVYTLFGRSGREPTKIDILSGGFSITNKNYFVALDENSFLEEYVNDLEVGYRINTANLHLETNFFYMQFENEIAVTGKILDFGVQRRQNISSSYRTGLELSANYRSTKGVDISLSGTYMKSQINKYQETNDMKIYYKTAHAYSPEWTINGNINYNLGLFSIGLNARFVSDQYMSPKNESRYTVPQYFVMDANLGIEWKMYAFRLNVYNLLDEEYYSYGTAGNNESNYFVNAPINIFSTFTFKF